MSPVLWFEDAYDVTGSASTRVERDGDFYGPAVNRSARLARQAGPIGIRAVWFVVPDPPLVRRGLGIVLRRVLPLLLTPERSDIEVVPGVSHLLVAAVVDEVGAEQAVAVADERVRAMPLLHAEVGVELVRHGVPGDQLPTHPRLQAFDVRLRGA